jgi:glycine/D-amino acid oxidase-like deaminating enzyme
MSQRIAVVGAGIIGALAAREILTSRPDARVWLIDRDLVGLGASQRSAGVHFPIGRTERIRSMATFSQAYYARWAVAAPTLPFHKLNLYAVASSEVEPAIRSMFVAADKVSMPPSESEGLLPWPEGFVFWHVPGCHYADVSTLVRVVARELRERATLLEGVAVVAVAERLDGADVTLGTGDILQVEKVVLAPGPWIKTDGWCEFIEPLGLRVKKIVAFHLDHPLPDGATAVLFPEEDAFIVPMHDRGYWLFSYTCPEWDVAPDELHGGISDRNLTEAKAILRRYAAGSAPTIRAGRVFCDAYSPAREPVVGAVGTTGNVIFAGGACGSGYRLAPGIASEVTRLLN